MRITVFEKRKDGSLDMKNPIIADSENIPEGLFLADSEKVYNDLGYEIDPPEPQSPEPSESERLEALEMLMVDILGGGF